MKQIECNVTLKAFMYDGLTGNCIVILNYGGENDIQHVYKEPPAGMLDYLLDIGVNAFSPPPEKEEKVVPLVSKRCWSSRKMSIEKINDLLTRSNTLAYAFSAVVRESSGSITYQSGYDHNGPAASHLLVGLEELRDKVKREWTEEEQAENL
jgi:hypothetical protein